MCHQRHNGQGLTGRLDIGCGSPAALPRGARRKVQSAECAKKLAAGEQRPRRLSPPASMIKGPWHPLLFSGGASDSLPAARDSCAPSSSATKHLRTTPCISQAQSMPARSGDDWCVFRTSTTRAPNPPSRLIYAIPAHIAGGTCARKRGCSHMSDRCQPRGVGLMKRDSYRSSQVIYNDLDLQGWANRERKKKTTQWASDDRE